MLRTTSSTNLPATMNYILKSKKGTHPLQLINVPTVVASRILNPAKVAPSEPPVNFPHQSMMMRNIVKPQICPVFKSPRFVERPESVKYCIPMIRIFLTNEQRIQHTRGRKIIATISSSFSVRWIAKPPSLGTARPAKKPPKIA